MSVEQRWNLKANVEATERTAWFVVRTNPRCETRAVKGLQERGFSTYLPVETKWRRSGRDRKRVDSPLMVGYLFAALAPGQSIYDVRRTDGVHSVVGVNGTPIAVDPWQVLRYAAAEVAGAFDTTGVKRPDFDKGDEVVIREGMFQGYVAKVDAMLPNGKVRVVLTGKHIKGDLVLDDDEISKRAA